MTIPDSAPADLRCLPRRNPQAHKGEFGRILVLAGSAGMHGAAALCAGAAFRSGAGLVTLVVPECIYPLVGVLEPRATYHRLQGESSEYATEADLEALLVLARGHRVAAIGPGLGSHPRTAALVRELVPRLTCPVVLDADGLNAFAGVPEHVARPGRGLIATPHPGELERLSGRRPGGDDEDRRVAATDLALRMAGCVVLKGARSVVTNGLQSFYNETGNPGMATAGTGDVLTGCAAALWCCLDDPLRVARMAAHAHGRAGDLAASQLGEIGMTATDLVEQLPHALLELLGPER